MRRAVLFRLLALATVLLLGAGVVAAATLARRGEGTYIVTAYFTKAIGLFPDSDVRVLGVTVGNVRSVTPEGPRVRVVMDLDRSRNIPADARAVIVPISLISDRYIQFFPTYESGPVLEDGAVLDIDRTSIPVELDDLLASLKKFLDAVEIGTREDPGAIGRSITNLAGALEGTGEDLSTTLGALGDISTVVVAEGARLESLIVHLNRVMLALAERRNEIARLNTGLARSFGAVAEQQAALDGTLTNLALITQELGSIVQQHRPSLEHDLRILSNTTQALMRHQDSLIQANRWVPVLADGLEEAHQGGAVHTVNGIAHIDVRDSRAACPFDPLICTALGLSSATASGAGRVPGAEATPDGEAIVPGQPEPVAPPSILPPAPEVPAPPELLPPDLPTPGAAGSLPPQVSEKRGWLDRAGGWIAGAADFVYRLFGGPE